MVLSSRVSYPNGWVFAVDSRGLSPAAYGIATCPYLRGPSPHDTATLRALGSQNWTVQVGRPGKPDRAGTLAAQKRLHRPTNLVVAQASSAQPSKARRSSFSASGDFFQDRAVERQKE
jgi:hypothetical protein